MIQCRCDFRIFADLALPNSLESHEFDIGDHTIIFKNGATNDEGNVIDLRATVIGPASSIDEGHWELRVALADSLDYLSFLTHSRFKILEAIRLVEWEKGKKEREFRSFYTTDGSYPPGPDFIEEFIDSVKLIQQLDIPNYLKKALKYFRYGLLDEDHEDQHIRFWLALEIIAENSKQSGPISILCPECSAALTCDACRISPTRVPMAKQAIENIIETVVGEGWENVSKRQFISRNTILHGGSTESIEKKTGISLLDAVNELGSIAWHAIMSNIEIPKDKTLNLGHRDWYFASKTLVVSMHGRFEHESESAHPTEDKIPSVDVKMTTRFDRDS